jgi:uncharacterized lipoprotein NlpE involved in copper resistance
MGMIVKKYSKAIFVLVMVIALMISGCSNQTTSEGETKSSSSKKTFQLKLGHVGPADTNHPWEKCALEFGKQLEESEWSSKY